MPQDNAARQNDAPGNRPVAEFRHGGITLAVWPNKGRSGTICSTTISNSYKHDKGEWKETSSFSPTDLLVVGELSREPTVALKMAPAVVKR